MLRVLLLTANGPITANACWSKDYDVDVTANGVLTDFCRFCCMNTSSCSLKLPGDSRQVTGKQLLRKARKAVSSLIALSVQVQEPTFSFLLLSMWVPIVMVDTAFRTAIPGAWQDVAMAHTAATAYAATAMSDVDTLSQLVQCNFTDILPAAVAEHTLTASALEAAPTASRPLILLIRALGAVAANILSPLKEGTASPADFLKLDSEMKQSALQHVEEDSGKEQNAVPALMRCAILLLKVADLTPPEATAREHSAIWMAVDGVAISFAEHVSAASTNPQIHGGSSRHQQQLALVLVQLILHILRSSQNRPNQDVWQTARSARAKTCFALLHCLVAWPPTQSTAISATYTKAGMALIAKGLVQAKPLALSAYSLISSVLSAPIPTSARDAIMKLLADMQGVRRLSNLLCPSFEDKQGYSFASASEVYKSKTVCVRITADGKLQFEAYNGMLLCIAAIMGAILYAHPYSSQQSPALQHFISAVTPPLPDAHPALDSPDLSLAHSKHSEQQLRAPAGQPEEPAQISANPIDQQSNSASGDHNQRLGSGLPEHTTISHHQQSHRRPDNEAHDSTSPQKLDQVTEASCTDTAEQQQRMSAMLDGDVPWATPSESVWADIETVALRALVTLHWATHRSADLVDMLTKLVHALLAGHVMDQQLDMTAVLRFGLTSVLGALSHTQKHPSDARVLTTLCLRHLACLLLRRMASNRLAFQALYKNRELVDNAVISDCPGRDQLWDLLCEYDAVAESAAMPSLLQEFVEAAYLLPRFASFVESFLSEEKPGDVSPPCANYMDAACLSFFHDAMLPPHPMHINLTSCACLLRFLADEIPDPEEPSQPYCGWDSYEGTIDDVCGCLHAGLQEVLRSPVEGDVRLKVGLARALYQAGPVIPQLFEMLPEQTTALVQLVVDMVRVSHLCSNDREMQEQTLRACLAFLTAVRQVHSESTQSHMTAVADVLFEWSSPWPIDQTAAGKLHSYVSAGLPDCEPANVCPQMVLFILSWEGEETEAWQKCVHQAMVASMCWLHSAGATALNTFPRDGPMTFGFREVEQSLGLISPFLAIPSQEFQELPGWREDMPEATSRAVLQLLFVYAMQLTHVLQEIAAAAIARQRLLAGNSGGRPGTLVTAEAGTKAASDVAPDKPSVPARKSAISQALIQTCLDELEKMRGHPVWGKALALIGVDGWSSDLKLVKDFQDHLRNAAADPLLDKEILQRLQITFLKPQNKQPEAAADPQLSLDAREAAAQQAAQQLLAEEDEQAARATAKKAKKLRQKLKKQQQAKRSQPSSLDPEDAAAHLTSMQVVDVDQPGAQTSAALHAPSQASPPEELRAESMTQDQGSGVAGSVAEKTERMTSPAEASSALFSVAQSSTVQDSVGPGQAGGSPGAIHQLLCCPLTKVMLVDPVIAADGHTYERAAFQDWLHHSAMSPVDGIPLKHTRLVTNQAIRNALAVQQRQ